MHAAAFTFAVAGRFAVKLGKHLVELTALGNQVTVAAVGAGYPVLVGQMHHHGTGDRLLAHIEVQCAGYLAIFHELTGSFFEYPDPDHAPMYIEQRCVGDLFHHTSPLFVLPECIRNRSEGTTLRFKPKLETGAVASGPAQVRLTLPSTS